MANIIPITEHFQHFLAEMKESFWSDLYGQTRQALQQFFSNCNRSDNATGFRARGSMSDRGGNGATIATPNYKRDFAARFGTIRLRIATHPAGGVFPVAEGAPAMNKAQESPADAIVVAWF